MERINNGVFNLLVSNAEEISVELQNIKKGMEISFCVLLCCWMLMVVMAVESHRTQTESVLHSVQCGVD